MDGSPSRSQGSLLWRNGQIMNKSLVLGTLSAFTFCLFACGDSAPEEKTGSNSEELNANCVRSIKGAPGSAQWRAELDKCLQEGRTPTTPPAPAPGGGDDGDDGAPGGGGQSCSTSIQCINGTCSCGSGANKGKTCDGTTATGANACSVVCADCK